VIFARAEIRALEGAMGWFGPKQNEEQIKRAMIRRYFAPEKGLPPWTFAAGGGASLVIMIALATFAISFYGTVAAAVLTVVLFAIAWVSFDERSQRADDDDIDLWREEDFAAQIERIEHDVKTTTPGLIEPRNPIVFAGLPRFQHLAIRRSHDDGTLRQRWRFKVKVGRDKVTRFTPPCLTVLHLTKDHLIAYQCDLSLLTGQVINETLDEYFWQDISTLQIERQTLPTETDDRQLYEQWSENMPEEDAERYAPLHSKEPAELWTGKRTILRLKTNSGGSLEIVLADERLTGDPAKDRLQLRNNEAINRLRKLLRDRKARR
jgi:hypothetical protein